ncbi:hypothetical protein HK096_007612, partial [Nowakowskiella sp. JEL0078]
MGSGASKEVPKPSPNITSNSHTPVEAASQHKKHHEPVSATKIISHNKFPKPKVSGGLPTAISSAAGLESDFWFHDNASHNIQQKSSNVLVKPVFEEQSELDDNTNSILKKNNIFTVTDKVPITQNASSKSGNVVASVVTDMDEKV